MTDAYDRVTYQGHPMDKMTRQAIQRLEAALGYGPGQLTVLQGCYAHTVKASAGTHDGGGAFDLTPNDWERKVRLGRELGLAIWHRTTIPGVWNEHVHAIVIGNDRLSPSAANQVTSYREHRNGLANNASDNTWHPASIKPFQYLSDAQMQHVHDAAQEAADMTPDQIASAPIEMLVGPNDKPTKVTLQAVLRDLEGTQDRQGAQLDRIEALLKKAIAGKA